MDREQIDKIINELETEIKENETYKRKLDYREKVLSLNKFDSKLHDVLGYSAVGYLGLTSSNKWFI